MKKLNKRTLNEIEEARKRIKNNDSYSEEEAKKILGIIS